jgi:AcrR family transcriptional regulator
MNSVEGQRRAYRMVARAEATEATGRRIVDAAATLFSAMPYEHVSLDAIAQQAATTVQTIIRRFHSKDELLAEVITRRRAAIHSERHRVKPGDVARALAVLFDEYERWGDEILLFLVQEGRNPLITQAVEAGRRFHQQWVRDIFSPALPGSSPVGRRRALHQITAATDLYVWKVLRRDLGLDERDARATVAGLVEAVITRTGGPRSG